MNFAIFGPAYGKAASCEPILRSLPDWFGMEEAIVRYAMEIDHQPTWLAHVAEDACGFLTLKHHNRYSSELYVMGIRPEAHRQGMGRALVNEAEVFLRGRGVEYLQVKTLGPSVDDEHYARTRAFYNAMGFRPLEELPQVWNEQNPCLIMIKRL
jgi:ribosomal protein S18 acetylase RimI-like enzyme